MTARLVRVAIVGEVDALPAHPALTSLEVVAQVQEIGELLKAPSHEHEVAIVVCGAADLREANFQGALARLARDVPVVLVVPNITRHASTVAARSRALGLIRRDASTEGLARAVRAVLRGQIAYPPEALTVLLRLLPPLASPRSSARATT
ncbi:MAG TPA: hypothetical protein VI814_03010 [Candidatus Limnocylindria bacterium]